MYRNRNPVPIKIGTRSGCVLITLTNRQAKLFMVFSNQRHEEDIMNRNIFTDEQIQILRENPYVYSVSPYQISLTKEFKEIFYEEGNKGKTPRQILEEYGIDPTILGEHRIKNIAYHIRKEYQKYGRFCEGHSAQRRSGNKKPDAELSEKEQLKKLQAELEFLREEMDFLKKISRIMNIGK